MRFLLISILSTTAMAQSAAIPALTVQLPAVVIQPMKCPVKNNVATCPQTTVLAASKASTTATTAPVTLGTYNYTFTLTPTQTQSLCMALINNSAMCPLGGSATLTVPITLTVAK